MLFGIVTKLKVNKFNYDCAYLSASIYYPQFVGSCLINYFIRPLLYKTLLRFL